MLENASWIKEVMAPIFVNSAKLKGIPSRFRAPAAITHAALLKGVVAPPRFVPSTSADHAAGEFILSLIHI